MWIVQSFSTAVCKQKQVIFNQKLINQLALLTGGGALQPHTHTYMCMFKTNDIKIGPGATWSLGSDSYKINILEDFIPIPK